MIYICDKIGQNFAQKCVSKNYKAKICILFILNKCFAHILGGFYKFALADFGFIFEDKL